jgi:probable F420-dependent oxidoreductase
MLLSAILTKHNPRFCQGERVRRLRKLSSVKKLETGQRLHVGIKVPNWGSLGSTDALSSTARLAEDLGFDSVWVSDHVVMPVELRSPYPFRADGKPPFDPRTPFQDPFVALAYIAAITRRVELGIGVLVLPMRHPILVAKQAATLDVLSGGRLVLGVGAGWMREEFDLLDQDFARRGHQIDEGIRTMRACWSEDPIDLGDRAADLGPIAIAPKPPRGPALPIWIGGHSEPALNRAARLGDGWYASALTPGDFAPRADEVRRRRAATRPGHPLKLGIRVPPMPDPADSSRLATAYGAAGADVIVFDMEMERTSLGRACEVIERTADALELDQEETDRR